MKTIICDMSGIVSIKGTNNYVLLNTLNSLKNIKFTFCTGKGFLGALDTVQKSNLPYPVICENGALIIDSNGIIIFSSVINYEKIKNIIEFLAFNTEYEFIACCNLSTNKYKFLYNKGQATEELKPSIFFNEETFEDIDEYLISLKNLEVVRVIYRGKAIDENILKKINLDFEISSSEREYYNFCNLGINKKTGVEKFIQLHELKTDDIILIGNDYNDVEMFKLDCYKKIAVGDDCPTELLELSDIHVTLDELPELLSNIDRS